MTKMKYLLAIVSGFGALPSAFASTTTLTFDDITAPAFLTTQYQSLGVTVSGAEVIYAILDGWAANTAPNDVVAPNGQMTFTLNPDIIGAVQTVSAYISGTDINIYAYDASGDLVAQVAAPTLVNNAFEALTSSEDPIEKVTIAGPENSDTFAIDTMTFSNTVPLPGSALLLISGLGLIGAKQGVSSSRRRACAHRRTSSPLIGSARRLQLT